MKIEERFTIAYLQKSKKQTRKKKEERKNLFQSRNIRAMLPKALIVNRKQFAVFIHINHRCKN